MTSFFARCGGHDHDGTTSILDSTQNLITAEKKFDSEFGAITTLESDLMLLAAVIYSADRSSPRGEREDAPREINVSVPVVNIGVLQPQIPTLERILSKLSTDSWSITFRQADGTIEKPLSIKKGPGKTLLFSGGLDSLAAAIKFGLAGEQLQLVSHFTHNQPTSTAQTQLAALLQKQMKISFNHRRFMVTAKSSPPSPQLRFDAESSQRTRSFLFMTLAALCARRVGHREVIFIAENGQMAIHLPLTQGRIGPFSTRTAHPDVLRLMEAFFTAALTIPLQIQNPFVNNTKAEVTETIVKHLPKAIPLSSSCWKNARLGKSATHCGTCIPCILRRISIETHCADLTAYARNLFIENISSLPDEDDGRINLMDYAEFMQRFESMPDSEIMFEWIELNSPNIRIGETIKMYRRAAREARCVFKKYRGLSPLIQ